MGHALVHIDHDATAALVAWSREVGGHAADDAFARARRRAARLGAHVRPDTSGTLIEFGFWAPDLEARRVPDERVRLELLLPPADLDPASPPEVARFVRQRLPLVRDGAYLWAAVRGLPVGTRGQLGALYALAHADEHGRWRSLPDPLAASMPFGAFAPSEVVDLAAWHAGRADADFFRRHAAGGGGEGPRRFGPPANILQLHVPTATEGGTLASLTRALRRLAAKLEAGEPLTPFERCLSEYDAIQPLPIEPTIERERGPRAWAPLPCPDADGGGDPREVEVRLRRPDVIDWGYDVAFAGMAATNPALLESGRPGEAIELAATLHTFPGRPMMLILDLVFGHADDQSLAILDPVFCRGPNMYGQDVNQQHPGVRALMLEMQRRRVNVGADGIRVDGAQDLKTYDPATGELAHDDDYLLEMGELVQEVAGIPYRPWCIFEDGRPWPREDWPTASRYREVTERQPHAFQWGPLTFAHNTPALEGFWWDRWWRVEQILEIGDRWISGCANHDTVRRGTQLDPHGPINHRLGASLPEVLRRAYDHPAGQLLTYAAFPGVPMDFLNAVARVPWGFVRDTDDRYAIKVAAEEAGFLDWQVDEAGFAGPDAFPRLKAFGFAELAPLQRAFRALEAEVRAGSDAATAAERVAPLLPADLGQSPGVEGLKRLAHAFMADAAAWCNVERHAHAIDPVQAEFGARVRALRRARPWLMAALGAGEHCRALRRDGATLVDALRLAPEGREALWLVANLEGEMVDVRLDAPPAEGDWTPLLASPGAVVGVGTVRLNDGEGLVLRAG
jgi:hypothetical protein